MCQRSNIFHFKARFVCLVFFLARFGSSIGQTAGILNNDIKCIMSEIITEFVDSLMGERLYEITSSEHYNRYHYMVVRFDSVQTPLANVNFQLWDNPYVDEGSYTFDKYGITYLVYGTIPDSLMGDEVCQKIWYHKKTCVISEPFLSFDAKFNLQTKKFNHFHYDEEVYNITEFPPSFEGGDEAMINYIKKELIGFSNDSHGRVLIKFIVNRDGSISSPKVLKSLSRKCDNKAESLVLSMPNWIPAKQHGIVVRCFHIIPVDFE